MTTYDANGIPHYQETDTIGLFSDLINLLADATSVAVDDLFDITTAIQTAQTERNVWGNRGGAAISGWVLPGTNSIVLRERTIDGIWECHFSMAVNSGFNLTIEGRIATPTGYKIASPVGSVAGQFVMEDVSAGPLRITSGTPLATADQASVLLRFTNGANHASSVISNTVPFTWAAGDTIRGYVRVPVVPA